MAQVDPVKLHEPDESSVLNFKCVIDRDSTIGKTYLLISHTKKIFPTNLFPTVFDNYLTEIPVDGKNIHLSLFDTCGIEDFDRLRTLSYPNTYIFLVCFDISSQLSFENVKRKWIPEIRHHCGNIPIILVGTKNDLREDIETKIRLEKFGRRFVSVKEGHKLAKEIKAVDYIECSALTQLNLKTLFDKVIKIALNDPKTCHSRRCNLM